MQLLNVLQSPWAIVPAKLEEIRDIYLTHLRGEKVDLKGIEARLGVPLDNRVHELQVVDGVGIISLHGILGKRMNLFSRISGGTSTQLAARDFKALLDEPSVKAIVLDIDSPGGTVDGTQELARLIFESRGQKQIVAITDGNMASAAYWIGSAAHSVFMTSQTVEAGSIGVVTSHTDVSKAEERIGIKTTEIVAGKFKRIDSQFQPLSQEGRQALQDMVDEIYSIFVRDVAAFRGASVETVLADMADGRLFIGEQAQRAGLVDGFLTMDQLVESLAGGAVFARAEGVLVGTDLTPAKLTGAVSGLKTSREEEVMELTLEALKEKHPTAYQAAVAEGVKQGKDVSLEVGLKEGTENGLAEGRKAGAGEERERIKAVESYLMPGHEALVAELKYDGKTTGPEAAAKILQAEKAKKAERLEAMKQDAPKPVEQPAVSALEPSPSTDKDAKQEKAIQEYLAEHVGTSYKAAALAVAKLRPELF